MIDLIDRLRDQREELKLKRFKDGGGQTEEGVNPFKSKFQQIKPFFKNMFTRVDMGEDNQPTTAAALGVVPPPVDYSLLPGLSGYTPPTSLSIGNPYLDLKGSQQSYVPGGKGDTEVAKKYQQSMQKQYATSSNQGNQGNQEDEDRNSLLTSLLASQGTSSLEGSLFGLGAGLAAKSGTTGKGLSIVGNAGALLFGGARSLLSGAANRKAFERNQAWEREALAQSQNVYNNAPQFQNANTTGGTTQGRYGGILTYEDGGNATFNGSEAGDKTSEYRKIAQQLSEQYPTIEELDKYLQSEGVPEEDHQGILEQAQHIYGGEMQPEQEGMDEEEGEQQSFREGGETQGPKAPFNKKVGDEIHFQYGGKTHKGTISKIENGKIYL